LELELKNISVTLADKKILKSIALKVKDGEFISLLGASGCGKTTLLKTIAGIITQSEGSIMLGGKLLDNIPTHKRGTVIVFQDFRLFPHMTVGENVSFPIKIRGAKSAERRKMALELLQKVKLEGFEDRKVNEISGGQVQRVALARAFAAQPTVLLLDEPFSSLDFNLRKDMRELVLELQREYKITTILVTHDHEEALTMSDRIAFMHDGHIEQYATPEDIFNNPVNTIVADYFSEGIYVDGTIEDNKFTSDLFSCNVNKQDGKYKCLIKPSAVKVLKSENPDFMVADKVYKGESYLLKLKNINNDLKLESIVTVSVFIEKGEKVSIDFEKNKLIFIQENK
jgi:putative spermidine/putrescine transport system ATP-binding protein